VVEAAKRFVERWIDFDQPLADAVEHLKKLERAKGDRK
jgi:hypothetical protein